MIAKNRNIRMSARKMRLVADYVRGMDVETALAHLSTFVKAAAKPIAKTLSSAAANAHHNFGCQKDQLIIKTIMVDKGAPLKRWRARARGSAAPIRKHACHLTIILDKKGEHKAQSVDTKKIKIIKKKKAEENK